jgi:hypothetical protein
LKFRDFFERSTEAKKTSRILLLTGDDPVLKELVIEHLGRVTGLWDVRERIEARDVRSIVATWEEGSLMGARFLDIRTTSKLKNNKLWKYFLAQVSPGQNYMTVSFQEDPPWEGILSRPIFQVVECKFPKRARDRVGLIDSQLKMKGCRLDPEIVKELAVRMKTTEGMESATTTLGILFQEKGRITEREITYVVGERDDLQNTSRAISRGNILVLLEEMDRFDPILLLSNWTSILKKLYCWISQTEKKDDRYEKPLDDEDGESEDESGDEPTGAPGKPFEIKLNRYQLEDFKIAKQRYSPFLIRSLMEDFNGVYQDIRRGNKEGWEERIRFILTKMPK